MPFHKSIWRYIISASTIIPKHLVLTIRWVSFQTSCIIFYHDLRNFPKVSDVFISTFRIAAAFTTVVTSFVSEILLPPLSLLPFINRNMDGKFAVLRRGPSYNTTNGVGYNTLQQAADDGAVVMAYGYVSTSLPQTRGHPQAPFSPCVHTPHF